MSNREEEKECLREKTDKERERELKGERKKEKERERKERERERDRQTKQGENKGKNDTTIRTPSLQLNAKINTSTVYTVNTAARYCNPLRLQYAHLRCFLSN